MSRRRLGGGTARFTVYSILYHVVVLLVLPPRIYRAYGCTLGIYLSIYILRMRNDSVFCIRIDQDKQDRIGI